MTIADFILTQLSKSEYDLICKQTSEKWFERYLIQYCARLGCECIKLYPISYTGVPDRMVLIPGGKTIFVELKSLGNRPSKKQTLVHNQFRSMGFQVLTAGDSVNSYIATLYEIYTATIPAANL